jgi:hypothetical protein
MNDKELIKNVIPLWYAEKRWAEELLVRVFGFDEAADVLKSKNRGDVQIPGTNWRYRTHGVGVDVYRTADVGGIDFDFDKPDPDQYRLKIFFEKQYNAGNLPYEKYRHLFEDEELLTSVIKEVIA